MLRYRVKLVILVVIVSEPIPGGLQQLQVVRVERLHQLSLKQTEKIPQRPLFRLIFDSQLIAVAVAR